VNPKTLQSQQSLQCNHGNTRPGRVVAVLAAASTGSGVRRGERLYNIRTKKLLEFFREPVKFECSIAAKSWAAI